MCHPTNQSQSQSQSQATIDISTSTTELTQLTQRTVPQVQQWINAILHGDSPDDKRDLLDKLKSVSASPGPVDMLVEAIPILVQVMTEVNQMMATFACEILVNLVAEPVHGKLQTETNISAMVQASGIEVVVTILMNDDSPLKLAEGCCKLVFNLCSMGTFEGASRHYPCVIEAVKYVMLQWKDEVSLQKYACQALYMMCEGNQTEHADANSKKAIESGCVQAVVGAMQRHADTQDTDLISTAIAALVNFSFAEGDAAKSVICKLGAIEEVVKAMQKNPNARKVQDHGCRFMRSIACYEGFEPTHDIILCVINAMRSYIHDGDMQERGCAALWNITANESSGASITETGGVQVILDAMKNHRHHEGAQEHAIGALWNLAVRAERLREEIFAAGGIELIVKGMATHRGKGGVGKEGAGALFHLSMTKDCRIRLKLVESGAIPELRYVFSENTCHWQNMNACFDTGRLLQRIEMALLNLGE